MEHTEWWGAVPTWLFLLGSAIMALIKLGAIAGKIDNQVRMSATNTVQIFKLRSEMDEVKEQMHRLQDEVRGFRRIAGE